MSPSDQEVDASFFEIESFHRFLSPRLARQLLSDASSIEGLEDLKICGQRQAIESSQALAFLGELYQNIKDPLKQVLAQRELDRKFLDERVKACFEFNHEMGFENSDERSQTVLGLEDGDGRVVFGPLSPHYFRADPDRKSIAPLPKWLQGPHVTLFGPPDSAKMAVNAMNSFHRKLGHEPTVVETLLGGDQTSPFWGADDEDSKTPLHQDLAQAGENLTACFCRELNFTEGEKEYSLADNHLAKPLKRFPGLALPCSFLFFRDNPIPLHLFDFALHVFHNHKNKEALTFYVPKLENEEEAAYIHLLVNATEGMIQRINPDYQLGTIRLMIVLENPRAILRLHEIIDALNPYFAGASLGWHDYLASTARLFKNDGQYRIPVKADPQIVIKYIKASHHLLADVVGSRGGIKVGGMYGILPQTLEINSESFQVTLKGFVKDVLTQLKRGLNGFWVAHPDFIRLGLALVKAWELHLKNDSGPLMTLVKGLLIERYHSEIETFILGADIVGLDTSSPQYLRSLIVANIKESDFIANNHRDEVRYNVFQSLQYLTDWLCGRGCVALPTSIDGIAVRVMDDLATAERSRWEVWHEIHHGRFSVEDFLVIAQEELHFIRKNKIDGHKSVQVKWDQRTEKWYPVALRIMIKLMTDKNPTEFATELLMPFTIDEIREAADPLGELLKFDSGLLALDAKIERFLKAFEVCGAKRWASNLSQSVSLDLSLDDSRARAIVDSFSIDEIFEAASFHGDIGEGQGALDSFASQEQALVFLEAEATRQELQSLGAQYLAKFGFKFLVSAQGKSGKDLLKILKNRFDNSVEEEVTLAREALWLISKKRLLQKPPDLFSQKIEALRAKYRINSVSLSLIEGDILQSLNFGDGNRETQFQIASLSKTIASAVAMSYFSDKGISLSTSVNKLLSQNNSQYLIEGVAGVSGDLVEIQHLLNHSALNMHYVNGFSLSQKIPEISALLNGYSAGKYSRVVAINEPGQKFQYSGGGYLVLEHLLEVLERKPIQQIMRPYLQLWGLDGLNLDPTQSGSQHAIGHFDDGSLVPGGRLQFPLLAAGISSDCETVAKFLQLMTKAYQNLEGAGDLSHDVAVQMLYGTDKGCRAFMGCLMGLGVFVIEAGPNKLMLHQGSNEGFRALFVQCFSGPDAGKGFVVFCNADNRGVLFVAEAAHEMLRILNISGIDFSQFDSQLSDQFSANGITQEQLVNQGYKQLIFSAFQPMLPERIKVHGVMSPWAQLNLLSDSKIQFVSNQKFARAENLISRFDPTFDPHLFGSQGKIMDSWESARHNPSAFDELQLELKESSSVKYIYISTEFHDGNQAEYVRILGADSGHEDDAKEWQEILPRVQMQGHSYRKLKLPQGTLPMKRIKIEMYPDGGLTRVGLFSDLPESERQHFSLVADSRCSRFKHEVPKTSKPLSLPYQVPSYLRGVNSPLPVTNINFNLASLALGARMVSATNEHYGPAISLLSPFPPLNMFDGIESARSREPSHFEEVVVALAHESQIGEIVLDFTYFVNNNPLFVSIEGLDAQEKIWHSLVERTNVKAFAGNKKRFAIRCSKKLSQIKLRTIPDGGVNRLYVYSSPGISGKESRYDQQ